MTPEQDRAIALATARRRKAAQESRQGAFNVAQKGDAEPPNKVQQNIGDVFKVGGRAANVVSRLALARGDPFTAGVAGLLSDAPQARLVRQGLTATFADEAVGVLSGEQAARDARAQANEFRRTNPGQAIPLELGGAAATFALGGGALNAAGRAIPAVAQAGAAIKSLPISARLAGQGAAIGGAFGAGSSEPGERAEGAKRGAAIGAIATPAINKIVGGAGIIFDKIARPIRTLLDTTARNEARRIRNLQRNAPTVQELKDQTTALFEEAKRQGVTATARQTAKFADDFDRILANESLITPKGQLLPDLTAINRARVLVADFANEPMTPAQMQNVRATIQEVTKSKTPNEARIGKILLNKFDDFVEGQAPIFKQARPLFQRQKKAELLDEAFELAAVRQSNFTQAGFESALRTEFRRLDRLITKGQLKGFSDAEIAAIRRVTRGTAVSNTARLAGKFAPTGAVSAGVSGGVPFLVGDAIGGPLAGGLFAGGTMAVGFGGRALATRMGIGFANTANTLVRSGIAPQVVQRMPIPQQEALALLIASQFTEDRQSGGDDNR